VGKKPWKYEGQDEGLKERRACAWGVKDKKLPQERRRRMRDERMMDGDAPRKRLESRWERARREGRAWRVREEEGQMGLGGGGRLGHSAFQWLP
jgi:hypothetical protein